MDIRLLLLALTPMFLLCPASASAQTSTVTLSYDCGAGATLMAGSNPYFGAAMPVSGYTSCTVKFTNTPFTKGAPYCEIMQNGARLSYTTAVSESGIVLTYSDGLKPPVWFQWSCRFAPQ